jgi:hypothetical protein
MAIAPHTTLPTFATATELCQYFLQHHQGDLDAAAQDMEALLESDKALYDAMVDELMRMGHAGEGAGVPSGAGAIHMMPRGVE